MTRSQSETSGTSASRDEAVEISGFWERDWMNGVEHTHTNDLGFGDSIGSKLLTYRRAAEPCLKYEARIEIYCSDERIQSITQQIRFGYPLKREMNEPNQRINVLFVCSRNQWRSPTAENIYRKNDMLNVKSCGTSTSARRKICVSDIVWADIVIVMENKHKTIIKVDLPDESKLTEIHVLNIEDDYKFMDDELIDELTQLIDPIIDNRLAKKTNIQ